MLIAGIGNESISYVMFQRRTTVETGADEPPYFVFDDLCNRGTDTLRSITLKKGKLLFLKALAEEKVFEITLNAISEEIALLASQLRAIFNEHEDKLNLDLG